MASQNIDPPIRGEWKVIHNPGDTPNALDFVGFVPGNRLPYPARSAVRHAFYRLPAPTAFGWERPVYAPFDGTVIDAGDGYPDRMSMNLLLDVLRTVAFAPDIDESIRHFAGNYVVIDGAAGVAFLAHFRRGSVTVSPGDAVTAGERIGRVGNSGTSLVPHLHFQVLREWPATVSRIAAADRPFRFRRYECWYDGAWRPVESSGPVSGDRIRVSD